jgi:hypothetical protein
MHLLLGIATIALFFLVIYIFFCLNERYIDLLYRLDRLEHSHKTISDLLFKHISRTDTTNEQIRML